MKTVWNTLLAAIVSVRALVRRGLTQSVGASPSRTRRLRQRYFPGDNPPLIVPRHQTKTGQPKTWPPKTGRIARLAESLVELARSIRKRAERLFEQVYRMGRSLP